jgi:hypothetical protein
MLPNFLIIGAMKCGTTSVYHYLREHPDVYMPPNKEPEFFSDERVWKKGLEWYEALFSGRRSERAVGEASTDYAKHPFFPDIPSRIANVAPNMKFIYVLRSPVERVYSHYVHNYYKGQEVRSLADAVLNDDYYVQISRYYYQMEQYWKYFPEHNLKIVFVEDIKKDPLAVIRELYCFLGVDDSFVPDSINEKRHETKNKGGMDNALLRLVKRIPLYHSLSARLSEKQKSYLTPLLRTRVAAPDRMTLDIAAKVSDRVEQDVLRLSTYLGRDLSYWLVR